MLYDRTAYFASICPSYESAHQALAKVGTRICLSSTQEITNALAEYIHEQGEVKFALDGERDDLAGKRVILSINGGRTRTREYRKEVNERGNRTYQTPWREPKLFIIGIINQDGEMDKSYSAPYGCRFEVEDCTELLDDYLRNMNIEQAESVQLVADGGPWIWQRVPKLFKELGVEKERLTYTLDYYHAVKYVNDLMDCLPQRIGKKERETMLAEFKTLLWQGQGGQITDKFKTLFKRFSEKVKKCLNYLTNNVDKMRYAEFRDRKCLCGSGIIESGVRRVINLRFKNTSTFWSKEAVEKLFFLRGAVLAGRWEIVMKNVCSLF